MQNEKLKDLLSRELDVLRISLQENCNFSCIYCKPENNNLKSLNVEQFKKIIFVACKLGVNSLRLTGGEPLLSTQLEKLLYEIKLLRKIKSNPISNLRDIALTTNGFLLSKRKANSLLKNGLDRITISLDAIDPEIFSKMIGEKNKIIGREKLNKVLDGIDNVIDAGFSPKKGKLKINTVIKKDINDNQIFELVNFARKRSIEIRFIEYMDVGSANNWKSSEVFFSERIINSLKEKYHLSNLGRYEGHTANRWFMGDSESYVSTVSSISNPFCSDCNRLRITSDGYAYTCLFSSEGKNLNQWLAEPIDILGLEKEIKKIWRSRDDKYSENRIKILQKDSKKYQKNHPSMSYLGG